MVNPPPLQRSSYKAFHKAVCRTMKCRSDFSESLSRDIVRFLATGLPLCLLLVLLKPRCTCVVVPFLILVL
jgi:hypothetical protein